MPVASKLLCSAGHANVADTIPGLEPSANAVTCLDAPSATAVPPVAMSGAIVIPRGDTAVLI
jgi:hypothetical protein